jgi:lipoprotein NlpI
MKKFFFLYKGISKELLCEAYTYIGFKYLSNNNKDKAKEYFKKSIKTDIHYFIEYSFSKEELENLK